MTWWQIILLVPATYVAVWISFGLFMLVALPVSRVLWAVMVWDITRRDGSVKRHEQGTA